MSESSAKGPSQRPPTHKSSPAEARQIRGRAADRDMFLKVAVRRLLWRMGCSTRLDVRLRGYATAQTRSPGHQDMTDLDVLGIGFTPGGQLHTTFADCRSNEKRAFERMFWVRGVADFVKASDAYLVRAQDVPSAVRTLSDRLGVGVLTPNDLTAMENAFPGGVDLETGPLSCLFNVSTVGIHLDANSGADRKLRKLIEYLEFDYWVYDPHRNLSQLVAHMSDAVSVLDPTNRKHRTLFYDCAWHYVLAIVQAVAYVRSTRMGNVPTAVRTYVAGGELAFREKAALAAMLERNGWPADPDVILPPYIEQLTELIKRFLVRPTELADVLRYGEYLSVSEVNHIDASVATTFGEHTHPGAAKRLADTCGFLVTAAGLRPEFRTAARERLVVDLTGGSPAVGTIVPHAAPAVNSDKPVAPGA
jgi:hypothetical protein